MGHKKRTRITVLDALDNSPIANARVFLHASDNTGDLPYNVPIGIVRFGSQAVIFSNNHPFEIGQKIFVAGADQPEYNGIHTITNTQGNAYSYPVIGFPQTPATGAITNTGVVISGLTNNNGRITDRREWDDDQPVFGRVRKSTVSPFYKQGKVIAVVDENRGLNHTVSMVLDE